MYTLTLTSEERKAIDWIGNRYEHGDDLYRLLCDCTWTCENNSDDYLDWDCSKDLLVTIPENVAWQIKDLLQNCNFECFAESLVAKFVVLLEGIV